MNLSRFAGVALVGLVALLFGVLLAAQLRVQLINPSNRVQRNQALVDSVRQLEGTNAADRAKVASLRSEITSLESQAARRSDTTMRLQQQVDDLRAHAGLTRLRGPGVSVQLANGRPGASSASPGYLVDYQDVQDVVNALWAGGAEGIAVNGQRLTPLSAFTGSGSAVVIDRGAPLASPFTVTAVGNRSQLEQTLADPPTLGDLKLRQREFQLQLAWTGAPELSLPAYDGDLQVSDAQPL